MDDVTGVLLIVGAIMFLLALMSYDLRDLPEWSHLATSDVRNPVTKNFMGRIGALLAGYSLFFMGMATYLVPFSLAWLGVAKLNSKIKLHSHHWIGVALLVVSAAGLIEAHSWFGGEDDNLPLGGGGGVGYLVGGGVFSTLLGTGGLTLIHSAVYLGGILLVTGLHPLEMMREIREAVPKWIAAWEARREESEREAAMAAEQAAPPKPKRRRKKKAESAEEGAPELPLKFESPPPKIIDANATRTQAKGKDKPRLAEVWEKKRAQKMEQAPHGSLGSLTVMFKNYKLPGVDLLEWPEDNSGGAADQGELLAVQSTIVRTLSSFGIKVEPGDITRGPAITRYEVRPEEGLRVSRISALDADIARATCAERINILAPIPGKDTVGIELANADKVIVPIRELLEDDIFQNGKARIPLALGKDVYGKTIIGDLASMPHLLVAGATGSGKSVCINGIVTSLLCRFAPDELRFIMIDPKVVEMQNYADLPHLALPVVTDPKKALMALRWVVKEMENRYQIFAQEGCRNFDAFNSRNRKRAAKAAEEKDNAEVSASFAADLEDPDAPKTIDGEPEWDSDAAPPAPKTQELVIPDTMPYIVVIIDELADLMQTAPADIEVAIARITQMARAAGIHLIVATQTPRADVITGVIKANIPTRIAFQVASALDSRVILDRKGAENLVGKGDMLYVPPGGSSPIRSQGAYVNDDEIHSIVERCVEQGKPVFDVEVNEETGSFGDDDMDEGGMTSEEEDLLEKCLEVIRQEKKASTSLLQRRLRLGYGRAARMMDVLEDRGIIGPGEGAKPREILVDMG
jgi:S-DNA-T family DNA segregation ATPase FtsK/SpoIIIE